LPIATASNDGAQHILDRHRAGIDAAKKQGVYRDCKATVPIDVVRRMRDEGKKAPAEIAEAPVVSGMSMWRR
jgi:DNA invertase Pin-like site-specific DNA recombinase